MFRFLRIPFQFKVYLLIFALFAMLVQSTISWVNHIVAGQALDKETKQFEGLKSLFSNMILYKIESLVNEARLLADQTHIRESLEMLNQGTLVESYLASAYLASRPRSLAFFTGSDGRVVDGSVVVKEGDHEEWITDFSEIQRIIDNIKGFDKVFSGGGAGCVAYAVIEKNHLSRLFAIAAEPVWDTEFRDRIVGSVTLGFPIDEEFARDLQGGSSYQVGFIAGNQIVTTTLEPKHADAFRVLWDITLNEERQQLMIGSRLLNLSNDEFLVSAAHLPLVREDLGSRYMIFLSLRDFYQSLQHMRQTVIWVSLLILCGMLILGYVLARGVTAPVRRLVSAVSKIAEGNYSVNPRVRSGDELQTLGEEIRKLAIRLHNRETEIKHYVKEIEEWNRELNEKVRERTKDLEEKNFRLRTISKELGQAYARIDDELKVVGEIQKKLLPEPSVDMEGLSIRSFYNPNGRAGGDYFDFVKPDGRHVFCLIADVSGHGTPAAFIMGITRAIAHSLIGRTLSTAEVLVTLSNTLKKTVRGGEFVTMFLGRFDLETQELRYSIAGHSPPLLCRRDGGGIVPLRVEKGLPLGIVDDPRYEELGVSIQPGDRLLMYTDGIVEAFNESKTAYGEERLERVMRENNHLPPDGLLAKIMDDLQEFVQRPLDIEPLEDDVTLVAVDFKPIEAVVPARG